MLLWADGFEHYGDSAAGRLNMLKGEYLALATNALPVSENPRTGSKALRWLNGATVSTQSCFRRALPGALKETIGFACGIRLSNLPVSGKNNNDCFILYDNAGTPRVSIGIRSDGGLTVFRGTRTSGTIIGITDAGLIIAEAYTHIEFKVTANPLVGRIEIRVNGVEELVIEDQNFGEGASQIELANTGWGNGSTGVNWWIDDVFAWDEEGDVNNDFIGPARVLTLYPDGQGAVSDMPATGAASASAAVDDNAPDDDTTYITAAEIGDVQEFTVPDLPPETTTLAGIYVPAYARLAEPGAGKLRVGFKTADGTSYSAKDIPLNPNYTYRGSVVEVDANGDPFTKASFEAGLLRIEKVE